LIDVLLEGHRTLSIASLTAALSATGMEMKDAFAHVVNFSEDGEDAVMGCFAVDEQVARWLAQAAYAAGVLSVTVAGVRVENDLRVGGDMLGLLGDSAAREIVVEAARRRFQFTGDPEDEQIYRSALVEHAALETAGGESSTRRFDGPFAALNEQDPGRRDRSVGGRDGER
jgi:hypothetical protein